MSVAYKIDGIPVDSFIYQAYINRKHENGEAVLYTEDYIVVTYFTLQSSFTVTYDRCGNPISNSATGNDSRFLKARHDLTI
ncbi:hypothetical protein phiAS5_ORF0051 [Aeromonas phage phiAS5]|uniref:Uncharacterized protein n=1 Tax=Aeromonas phage phiAS5 TaxID=879630 RepID=E1A2E8_9CAUD|nr:hypothetical protein phiAS5_ORF0051 [Aeromonas phage phiAS5]ADM79894.1 hypothetical protein phiAS5_ORF0051 [Aeromonas phage phiAS5]BES53337.1 hypothetical protein [Aeromonas phage phiWae14]